MATRLERSHSMECYQNFYDFVTDRSIQGEDCKGNLKNYVPYSALKEYWTETRIKEILFSTFQGRPPVWHYGQIREKYLRIFSILVCIKKSGPPRLEYMRECMNHEKDDSSLPWPRFPARFPRHGDWEDFFHNFSTKQWEFCPTALNKHSCHHEWQRILPISRTEDAADAPRSGQAKVTKVKVHPDACLSLPESCDNFVMFKTYSKNDDSFQNENDALTSFYNVAHGKENLLHSYGSFHWVEKGTRTKTIITEFADRGSLLDMFQRRRPPHNQEEICCFWDSILGVLLGLETLHHEGIPGHDPYGYSGVHQDLKPSNLLVFSSHVFPKNNFDVILKVGDLGTSHIRRAGPTSEDPLGHDRGGTKTYGPPELLYANDVNYAVGPWVDTWAIGCILIEAAVWVVYGEHGRTKFREERIDEIKETSKQAVKLGFGDSFHNGGDVLHCVENIPTRLQQDGRRCDNITTQIVQYVLKEVLISRQQRHRMPAGLLHARLLDCLGHQLGTVSGLTRISSREAMIRQRERIDFDTPINTPQAVQIGRLGAATASSVQPSNRNQNELPVSSLSDGSLSHRPIRSTGSTGVNGVDHRHDSLVNGIAGIQTAYAPHPSTIETSYSMPMESMLNHPDAHTMALSPSPAPAYQSFASRPATQMFGGNRDTTPDESLKRSNVVDSVYPMATLDDLTEWREKKQSKVDTFLRGMDTAMPQLMQRNHLYLVDNSKHMQNHKDHVVRFVRETAYLLKNVDDDGVLDLYCTSHPQNPIHEKKSRYLSKQLESKFSTSGPADCNIELALNVVFNEKFFKSLHNKQTQLWPLSRSRTSPLDKPLNIYILTNGIWSSGDGLCGADRAIGRLIRELKERNLTRTHISLQFVRFGNSERGVKRLTYLDDELGRKFEGFDIVDHKDVNGNIWSILIGSLDENIDRE